MLFKDKGLASRAEFPLGWWGGVEQTCAEQPGSTVTQKSGLGCSGLRYKMCPLPTQPPFFEHLNWPS